jgi:hypothetical protein
MAILTVGPGQQFSTLSSAIAASHNGDTIDVQAGTYTNDFALINDNITIQGVGGMVNLVATTAPPNGKAILVTNGDITINDVSFSGTTVPDGNGAGIRYESGNLTLNDDYFHDNQDGLLAAANPQGSITINNTEFSHNGTGDGSTHNLYVNEIGTLTIENSLFTNAVVGHEIKSRADNTIIENSRIIDGPTGTASYSIDLPDGGNAVIKNNVIEQGPLTQNPAIIHYGGEGGPYANSSLQITGNTILNDDPSSSAIALLNQTSISASITNNETYGLTSNQISNGPSSQSGNTMLSSEPTLDLTPPWQGSNPTPPPPSGSGLTLHVSGDAWQGDPEFVVLADGVQVGGPYDVSASHSAGQWQDVTVAGDFSHAQEIDVKFINDAYGGTASTDRNLYVDSLTVNGQTYQGEAATNNASAGYASTDPHAAELLTNGTLAFNVSTPPATPPSGTGLTLHVSGDAWQGDPDFIVLVDGKQVGGTYDVSASHSAGQWQDVTIAGDFSQAQEVDVKFVNDAWGGTASTDRNLYVDSLTVNGQTYQGEAAINSGTAGLASSDPHAAELYTNGTLAFNVASQPTSGAGLTLHVSGDAWQGDPEFIVLVDGKQVGGTYDVSASHSAGQWQNVSVAGDFSQAKEIDVQFVNDAWGGTASTDRNLYVDTLTVNGLVYQSAGATNNATAGLASTDPHAAELYTNGTLAFHLTTMTASSAGDYFH